MNGEERGRRAVAFLGESFADESVEGGEGKPATLDEAMHDAAEQAAAGGYIGQNLRVVLIEFKPGNPHIKELKVIVTPGGGT
ncbi:MAG: hypothetical protein H0U82_01760 [Actinobacteria bacterium]|nr:hypothetical protein [Actinomycetota bacterium]